MKPEEVRVLLRMGPRKRNGQITYLLIFSWALEYTGEGRTPLMLVTSVNRSIKISIIICGICDICVYSKYKNYMLIVGNLENIEK